MGFPYYSLSQYQAPVLTGNERLMVVSSRSTIRDWEASDTDSTDSRAAYLSPMDRKINGKGDVSKILSMDQKINGSSIGISKKGSPFVFMGELMKSTSTGGMKTETDGVPSDGQ